jgi:hypothetical protein
LFWLTALVGIGLAWWGESRARRGWQVRWDGARRAIHEMADMTGTEVEEQDGQFVIRRPHRDVLRKTMPCKACGEEMVLDELISQSQARDKNGERIYCWQIVGRCESCRKRFALVVSPEDAPGFRRWLEVKGEQGTANPTPP